MPAGIYTNPETTEKIVQYLENNSVSYIRGLTWTADAIFRETNDRITQRKAEGVKTVGYYMIINNYGAKPI